MERMSGGRGGAADRFQSRHSGHVSFCHVCHLSKQSEVTSNSTYQQIVGGVGVGTSRSYSEGHSVEFRLTNLTQVLRFFFSPPN